MKSQKIVIALFAALFATTSTAQEQQSKQVKEYGIGLTGLNNFSLQYRWGNESRLYRLSGNIGAHTSFGNSTNTLATGDTLNRSYSGIDAKKTSPININVGLGFSKLHLKFIDDKFGFMYGPSVGAVYQYSKYTSKGTGIISNYNSYPQGTFPNDQNSSITAHTLVTNIGFVVGAVYKITSAFFLYAEINPNVFYSFTNTHIDSYSNNSRYYVDHQKNSNNNIGISNLSNSGAMLTLVYRITK